MRGRPHDDNADMVTTGISDQGLRHIARFEHVVGGLVVEQVQRLCPLAQAGQVVAVHMGFAGFYRGAAGLAGRDHGDAGQAGAGPGAQRACHGLAQRVQGGVLHVLVGNGHHDDRHLVNLL